MKKGKWERIEMKNGIITVLRKYQVIEWMF